MDTVLAMSDIHPRDRVTYWLDVASKALLDHECQAKAGSAFDATLLRAPLGELSIMSLETLGLETVNRTPRSIAHGEDNVFLLYLQLLGSATFIQDGRETVTHPGDLVLVDAQRPFTCRYEHRKQITIKIPHRSLKARLASSSQLTARAVRRTDGVGALASDYIKMMSDHIDTLQLAAKLQVAEHTLDLAALAFAAETSKGAPALSSGRAVALLNLRMAIESRLKDPALNPAAAATAAGISVRYANNLLSQQGTSLERFIVSRRVELPPRPAGPPATPSHHQRDRLRVGLLRPVALQPPLQGGLRIYAARLPAPTPGRGLGYHQSIAADVAHRLTPPLYRRSHHATRRSGRRPPDERFQEQSHKRSP